jgi:hypothetical protein
MLKKLLLVVPAFLLVLSNCSRINNENVSGVNVENQSFSIAFALPCNESQSMDSLNRAVAVISGTNMDSIYSNLKIESCKLSGTVHQIPCGEKRKIDILVYTKSNNLAYTGTTVFDVVSGKATDIVLKLTSQTGSVNITGIICDTAKTDGAAFVPDLNTVALYHFNEDTGSILYDEMLKWNGTLKSGTRVGGYQGTAIKFAYNNSALFDTILPDNMASGTIELYFKFDNSVKSDSVYLLFGTDGSRCNIYYNNGYILYMKNHSDLFKMLEAPLKPVANTWYHIAGTWGAKGMQLFIDGVLVSKNMDTSSYQSSPRTSEENVFKIGDKSYCCMNGAGILRPVSVEAIVDEIRISNIQRY